MGNPFNMRTCSFLSRRILVTALLSAVLITLSIPWPGEGSGNPRAGVSSLPQLPVEWLSNGREVPVIFLAPHVEAWGQSVSDETSPVIVSATPRQHVAVYFVSSSYWRAPPPF